MTTSHFLICIHDVIHVKQKAMHAANFDTQVYYSHSWLTTAHAVSSLSPIQIFSWISKNKNKKQKKKWERKCGQKMGNWGLSNGPSFVPMSAFFPATKQARLRLAKCILCKEFVFMAGFIAVSCSQFMFPCDYTQRTKDDKKRKNKFSPFLQVQSR